MFKRNVEMFLNNEESALDYLYHFFVSDEIESTTQDLANALNTRQALTYISLIKFPKDYQIIKLVDVLAERYLL